MGLSIVIASLFALLPNIDAALNQTYWAALTVGFITSPDRHASLTKSMNRLLGTVVGAVYGSAVFKLMNQGKVGPVAEVWLSSLALGIWGVVTGFVRTTPAHSYTGMVSGFTAGIIMLGYNKEGTLTRDEYALARVEMTCCGILIWLLIVQCVSMRRAANELHIQTMKSVQLLGKAHQAVMELLAEPEDKAKFDEVMAFKDRINAGVALQVALISEAAAEPRLWHPDHAPKAAAYKSITEATRTAATALGAMAHAAASHPRNLMLPMVTEFNSYASENEHAKLCLVHAQSAMSLATEAPLAGWWGWCCGTRGEPVDMARLREVAKGLAAKGEPAGSASHSPGGPVTSVGKVAPNTGAGDRSLRYRAKGHGYDAEQDRDGAQDGSGGRRGDEEEAMQSLAMEFQGSLKRLRDKFNYEREQSKPALSPRKHLQQLAEMPPDGGHTNFAPSAMAVSAESAAATSSTAATATATATATSASMGADFDGGSGSGSVSSLLASTFSAMGSIVSVGVATPVQEGTMVDEQVGEQGHVLRNTDVCYISLLVSQHVGG